MSGFELQKNAILRIELEHIKSTVHMMLQNHSNEMQQMVTESLNRTINEEWVQANIDNAIKQVINEAINEVTNSYKLKRAIADLIDDAVVKMVENTKIGGA